MRFKFNVLGKYLPQRNTTNTDEILFNEGSHYSQSLTQIWLTLPHLRLLNFAPNCQYFVKAAIPGVPKKKIPCLISCNVKPIKAISLK